MTAKKRIGDVVNQLIIEGKLVMATQQTQTHLGELRIANPTTFVGGQEFAKWRAGCLNLIRLLGRYGDTWSATFQQDSPRMAFAKQMLGTLEAIQQAVTTDLLVTVEDLVIAEAFADLLEQAEYLLNEDYVLAAGVIGRAVLEEHLRKLCRHCGCMPAKPRPTMSDYNGELYKSQNLSKLEMKHVESMTAVGNEAAHAKPVAKADVERFLRDLTDFLAKHSAS